MKLFLIYFALLVLQVGCSKSGDKQAAVDKAVSKKSSPLIQAILADNLPRVQQLTRDGADLNENVGTAEEILTPLLVAIARNNDAIALHLLRSGASLRPTYHGYSAKDFALNYKGGETAVYREMERAQQ